MYVALYEECAGNVLARFERYNSPAGFRTIINSGSWTEGYVTEDPKELRESRNVTQEDFGFQNEVNIYGDKVAIINSTKDEKLIGILINNPLIAATLRGWFELTWSKLD